MRHGQRILGWILLALGTALALLGCGDDGTYTTVRPAFTLRGDVPPVLVGRWTPRALLVTNTGDAAARLNNAQWVVQDDTELRVDAAPTTQLAPGESATLTFSLRARSPGAAVLEIILAPGSGAVQAALRAPFEKRDVDFCDDGNDCTADVLNLNTGSCQHSERNGSCDDGSACTTGDVCNAGRCVGEALQCDDGIACTADICDPEQGCTVVPQNERCDDDVSCSDNVCTPTGCEYPPSADGTPCGEYDACVTVDICINQACVAVDIPEDAPCDDGDACTADDRCHAGQCDPGAATDLPPPVLDAFASQWIVPDELTLVPGGWVSSAVLGDRATFQSVQLTGADALRVTTHPDLSAMMPASASLAQRTGRLVHVEDSRYARIRAAGVDDFRLEIIDVSDLSAPVLLAQRDLGAPDNPASGVAVQSHFAYVCGDTNTGLLRFDINHIDADPLPVGGGMCSGVQERDVLTAGNIWAEVGATHLELVRLLDGGLDGLASWAFAPDGISQYGEVIAAFISDDALILDIEHPTKYFAHDLQASQVVYGNAPGLNGRRIIGLDEATVLIESAPGVIARGTFNDDLSSFVIDENDTVTVPVNWDLAAAIGWTIEKQTLRILDADSTRWMVRGADHQVYIVPKDGSAAWRPDQSKEITNWVKAGERLALVARQRVKRWDSFDALMAQSAAQEVVVASDAAFLVGASSAADNVMGGRGFHGEAGACFQFCEQPPAFSGDSVRVDLDAPLPLRLPDAGSPVFQSLTLASAPTTARGCLLAQASNAGHLRVADRCEGTSFSEGPTDGVAGIVTVQRVPMIHDDDALTLRGLYGEAKLVERIDGAFVETQRLATGYTGEHASSAALSDDWWVVSMVSSGDRPRLFVIDRSDGTTRGTWELPERDAFADEDTAAVLAILDGVIYLSHFDASGDSIIGIGEDAASPGGLSEIVRIRVPSRPLALELDDISGTFRILTGVGVGTLTPVCLGEATSEND